MKDNFKIAIEFANEIKKLRNKDILQIILFGSVARGEDTAASDIDIAIIHDLRNVDKIKTYINKFLHDKIQVSYFSIKQLPNEIEMLSSLTGEGILLYGHPINVKLKSKELKPKILLIYDTSKIPRTERMKLNRALHGSISKSRYKKREYVTKTTGILKEKGIEKLAKAVLLTDPKKAHGIIITFKIYNIKWREMLVWV
ncbi:nucleotidyltransferase domain-containing protein [Candidatus Woesearchaeota archaeon]|nr:nucleotidyltransferase domain-containing protein [Candidatus Woesearchaeota archaeon]